MDLLARRSAYPDVSASARSALAQANQQIRPARRDETEAHYDVMLRKLDSKPSKHEIIQSYSPA